MLSAILKYSVSIKTLLTDVRSVCKITQKYLGHDKNVFPMAITVRTFLTRSTRLSDGLVQSANLFKSSKLPRSLLVRHQQTIKLDMDTNICNNVILYKNDNNPRYLVIMRFCGIAQLIGGLVLAFYSYTPSFFDIFRTDTKFKEYAKKNMLRFILFSSAIFLGPFGCTLTYLLTSHTIKYIILHKGGKKVTLTTFHLWKKDCNIQISTNMIRCTKQRISPGLLLPIKLKNKSLYYIIERKGTFLNPELFDNTVGYTHFQKL